MKKKTRSLLRFSMAVLTICLLLAACTVAPAVSPVVEQAASVQEAQPEPAVAGNEILAEESAEAVPAAEAPEEAAGPRFDGVTLHISVGGEVYTNIYQMFADDIREIYGIEMEYTVAPPQDVYQRDMLEFSSGSSSHDIVHFQPPWLPDYAPHLADLSELAEKLDLNFQMDDAVDVFNESYTTWDGKFLAVPFDADQHNLYYNKVAFEDERNQQAYQEQYGIELKVPDTWDEYVQLAEFFNGRDWDFDGEPEYGVVEAWGQGGYATFWWTSKFYSYGGSYFDNQMNPLINSPAGVKALETMLAIKDFVPPGVFNFGSGEARAAFLNGDVPMVIHWTSTAKLAKNPESSQVVDVVGVAMVPGVKDGDAIYRRPALPTGGIAGISAYSENQDAAAVVLAYVYQPENATAISLNPDAWAEPWRKSSFKPELWEGQWPDDPEYGRQLIAVMEETVSSGVPDLQIPGQDEYLRALDTEISSALSGNKSAQEALDAAADEWNKITGRRGLDQQLKYWQIQNRGYEARGITYRPELAQ